MSKERKEERMREERRKTLDSVLHIDLPGAFGLVLMDMSTYLRTTPDHLKGVDGTVPCSHRTGVIYIQVFSCISK